MFRPDNDRRPQPRRHARTQLGIDPAKAVIMMLIKVNTDNHIDGSAEMAAGVEAVVEDTLAHFAERLTRVEVHLSDENSHKGGDRDKRCVMEARAQGLQPIAVTHDAGTADEAVDGAAEKLKHALETHFGRLESR